MNENPDGTQGRKSDWIGMAALFAVFATMAIALKVSSFGDTNRGADELYYLLVGQRMHEGLLPYVDVWDRKPLGLFLIYYAIAGLSASILPYQVIACLLVATTAAVIARLIRPWAGWTGGLLGGVNYVAATVGLGGATGQTPDFYNLLIATAALLVVTAWPGLSRGTPGWRVPAAMALCGVAITIKQTSLFESLFLGLAVLVALYRAGASGGAILRVATGCAAIGAMPALAIAAFYAQVGHWSEFWSAMVTSNFVRGGVVGRDIRAVGIVLQLAPLMALAVWGLLAAPIDRRFRGFLAGWLLAALIGFLSVPNFIHHLALPLLVPLSAAAGLALGRDRRGLALGIAALIYASLWYALPSPATSRASAEAMQTLSRLIRKHDAGGGLLVFDGPSYLYSLSGKPFLSPLVFPHHLSNALERNVSHLDTDREVDRVLAGRPGVIVMATRPYIEPVNGYARARVLAYARANCRTRDVVTVIDGTVHVPFAVLGECSAR